MKNSSRLLCVASCVALFVASVGLADLALAQTETVTVHVGTGTVMHRSGSTLIINVTEGERGPGIRKFNIRSTDGLQFKNRMGQTVEVFDLRQGEVVSAYRTETRPAPVVITMSEVEEVREEEPAAPDSEPEPEPAAAEPEPAPAPEPMPEKLPSTGSQLPLVLLLAVVFLSVGLGLSLARRRA